MKNLVIWGGQPLRGEVRCDGAKNAALPVLAGALLMDSAAIFDVPDLADVRTMVDSWVRWAPM